MLKSWLRIAALALLAAVAVPAAAPAPAFADTQSYSDFSGGLNTRISPVLLKDNESPNLQNVLVDENGAVTRRGGITKLNSTAVGVSPTSASGISDINAVYQLEQSGGNKYCVAFSSTTGYSSTDGCRIFSVFVSTLTRNSDVNCAAYDDKLYCVNNQNLGITFDGTNDQPINGAPTDLNVIKVFRNRCFGAGKDTNPSRLYWSNLGDCDTWTTASDYVDIDAEDGDTIQGINEQFNFLSVCKNYSTYLIQFDNAIPTNRKVINVSRTTGCKGHRSIANYNNRQYFASIGPNGGQPGVYSTDGILITEDTQKLRGSIDTLSNFFSNSGRETIDTKADYDAGSFVATAMSSLRDEGFMQSSYTAKALTTSSDWATGTLTSVSNGDVSGSVTLSSTTASDNFSDGNYTAGPATWTVTAGSWLASGNNLQSDLRAAGAELNNAINSVTLAVSSGSWSFNHYWSRTNGSGTNCGKVTAGSQLDIYCFQFRFLENSSGDFYAAALYYDVDGDSNMVALIKRVSGTTTILSESSLSYLPSTTKAWQATRNSTGIMTVYVDGVSKASATDTTVSNPSLIEIAASGRLVNTGTVGENEYFDDVVIYQYVSAGIFTSPIFDTVISTPIGGQFSSTFSVVGTETQIDFFVRESTSPNNDLWTSFAATSDTLRIPMSYRYQQVEARLYALDMSTKTPRLDAFGFAAASTGTWHSPELFLSNTMTAPFGLFQTNQTVAGSAGAIAYSIKTSTYAGGTNSASWVSITPGSAISASTGAYVVIVATFTIFSATETAKVDSMVINWNEGSSARSATMAVFKNRLHFCGQTEAGTFNDVCYVRDDKGAWVKWTGINARHLNVIGQNFVAGGSTEAAGGFLYNLYDTNSDDGAAISAFWESKDHILGKLENRKAVDRIFVLGSNDATTLTGTLKSDTGIGSSAFDISLSTGASFRIVNKSIIPNLNGNTFRIRFGNDAASKPWSVFGYGLLFRDLGLMQP